MRKAWWLAFCALLLGAGSASAGNRLDDIRARGSLGCGVWPHVAGFATERAGRYEGFEIDLCRAVATALLGDASKVRFTPVEHVADFIEHDDVDLVVRRLTKSLQREAETGTAFGTVVFNDGQGFLVPKSSGITSAGQLAGARVCVINLEHHPRTLLEYSRAQGADLTLVMVGGDAQAEKALRAGRCRAYSADLSWLAAARAGFTRGHERYDLLPELISEEPLAPLMRAEDTDLLAAVNATLSALLEAGTFSELYERNLGSQSPIQLDRSRFFLDDRVR